MSQSSMTPDEILAGLRNLCASQAPPPALPPPGAQIEHQHPLTRVDFWATLATLICLLLVTSSVIERQNYELVFFLAIAFSLTGLIANLTREREQITVYRLVITDSRPRAAKSVRSKPTLAERQTEHGVNPVQYMTGLGKSSPLQ